MELHINSMEFQMLISFIEKRYGDFYVFFH
jgi:hypothetical protein